jgi:MFS family permease
MNAKRIVIAGLVVWIVSSIIILLTCGWLFKWVYKLPPNIWRDFSTMPATAVNIIGPHVIGIIQGLLFALVFAIIYKGIPGKGVLKGIIYGVLVWLVGALTGLAGMPFYMTIATGVVVYWIIQQLVLGVINGAIVGAIYKEKKKRRR